MGNACFVNSAKVDQTSATELAALALEVDVVVVVVVKLKQIIGLLQ